jgi:hypothetical protein
MRVEIILDTTDHRDCAMRDEIDGWLHYSSLRGARTMTETEIETDDDGDDEGRRLLIYTFTDPLDAHDLCHWRGLQGRGRLI